MPVVGKNVRLPSTRQEGSNPAALQALRRNSAFLSRFGGMFQDCVETRNEEDAVFETKVDARKWLT